MTSGDLLSWLRSTIEGDKAAAEAAEKASPGPWVNTGQAGCGGAWQIHGGPSGELQPDWDAPDMPLKPVPIRVATLNYDDGGGVWEREAADHIVTHQPRDTIAHCEADLKILDMHTPVDGYQRVEYRQLKDPGKVCEVCCFDWDGPLIGKFPCDTLIALASGYRHRPGFNPEWVSE